MGRYDEIAPGDERPVDRLRGMAFRVDGVGCQQCSGQLLIGRLGGDRDDVDVARARLPVAEGRRADHVQPFDRAGRDLVEGRQPTAKRLTPQLVTDELGG